MSSKNKVIETKDVEIEKKLPVRKKKRSYNPTGALDLPCPDGFHCRAILVDSTSRPGRYMDMVSLGDYTPVTPAEIGHVEADGSPAKGDRIEIPNHGNGTYLWVKTPIEFFEEDQRQKTLANKEKLQPTSVKTEDGVELTGRVTLKQ